MATFLMSMQGVISVPCLTFALRRESMYFRRAYTAHQHFFGAPCRAELLGEKRCQEPFSPKKVPDTFFLLETGIGAAAMETALRWCLSEPCFGGVPYRPSLLLCAGFSGALQPEQRVGDLVMASEVVDQHGNCWPARILDNLPEGGIAVGRLLTMPELVSDPRQKQRLGRQHGALAVDMESAVAARLCHQYQVPFACLRVISDDWETELSPHLVEVLRHEHVSLPRVARQLLCQPRLIGELWRLAGQTRRASRRLLGPLSALLRDGLRTRVGG